MEFVIFDKNDQTSCTICIVEALSEQLKQIIRSQLISICQGVNRGESGKEIYSYRNTLKEFLIRYDDKAVETKKGIIGELLAHILFIENFHEFKTISPMFNMEERSIKKAFDIILLHSTEKTLYYTEVKSGEANNNKSDDKNITLLGNAKADIYAKLNDNNDNNWLNAINGATISLENKNMSKEIVTILEDGLSNSQKAISTSKNKNVIFVSVTFNTITDKISLKRVSDYSAKNKKDFNKCIHFSIQKSTYQLIEAFLRNEAANDS